MTTAIARMAVRPADTRFASGLPLWAELNDVSLFDVTITTLSSSGLGLLATRKLETVEDTFDKPTLITVPRDLILCPETVEEFGKLDHSFRELLDAVGRGTTRESKRRMVMLYLLTRILRNRPASRAPRGPRTPWSDYVKCLPDFVPVPTMWTDEERALLNGTSLEQPLKGKLSALKQEFELVESKASALVSWDEAFAGDGAATLDDWILVDALYRSRVLELPESGEALVPCIDMVNHSVPPNAYFEVNDEGGVTLLLHRHQSLEPTDEITISYGDKSAAEFLFSYGFVDRRAAKQVLVLGLEPYDDDPLARAKVAAFGKPGSVKIELAEDGTVMWDSPFAYFEVLNEEDGLEFRVLGEPDGTRKLCTFWLGEDVTDITDTFKALTDSHPLKRTFRLRVLVTVLELVREHQATLGLPRLEPEAGVRGVGYSAWQAASSLTEVETALLDRAEEAFDNEVTALAAEVFPGADVLASLGSMEVAQNAQAPSPPANGDDDDYS